MRRLLVGLVAATLGITMAACESTSDSLGSTHGIETVAVKLTDAGCSPAKLAVAAGPTTFAIENTGADGVTEFEILDGGKILGEKENLTPGLSGRFTLTLHKGSYVTYCPGGSPNERGSLVVGAADAQSTTPPDAAAVQQAVDAYTAYLGAESAQLLVATTTFAEAVKAGDIDRAKQLYPAARGHYERIEPVAESFGDLDPAIDAREGDVPADAWTGFHRIEQALWVVGSVDGMGPVADQLVADVTRLDQAIPGLELEPAQIANGAVDLLSEVSTSTITGQEDRYSHTDLWDAEANVLGAQAAFDTLQPLVAARDPELAARIPAEFTSVLTALGAYRQGDGYVESDQLTRADTRELATAVDRLADELAAVPPVVAGG